MKGIMENHPLFLSVAATVAGCAGCAWGVSPEFNALIHLEPFPDDPFRWKIMGAPRPGRHAPLARASASTAPRPPHRLTPPPLTRTPLFTRTHARPSLAQASSARPSRGPLCGTASALRSSRRPSSR